MKRNYEQGQSESANFFVGSEVEHTPAYGKKTLFVVGLHPVETIKKILKDPFFDFGNPLEHIFFGANHSFNPQHSTDWGEWEDMIEYFLEKDYLCSLDIPIKHVEEFHENGLCDFHNFIPQIRVPIPYIKLWNYNTMLKIDDIGFNKSNPGVWSYSLHSLMDRKCFTDWNQYKKDTILK